MAETALPPTAELLGLRLHGENLDDAAMEAWFADEQEGYADLVGGDESGNTGAVNRFHALRHLGERRFACCLALGAASGREYNGLAGRVDRFIAVEPGRRFWRTTIAGAPAEYRLPTVRGTIDLPDGSCDLAGSFGVLHHVANVSEVIAELARVIAPGGMLLIREPISSLGDFRRPRPGLTRNERGIPPALMDRMLGEAGFTIRARSFIDFPGGDALARRLGIAEPWNDVRFVRLDHAVSSLMAWNARYWRPRLVDKLAPRAGYWVAERS